jgi:hypothetical protein
MNEMIQSLEEKKYSNSTPQQMFIQHLAKYNKQLQEEWRNQLSQGLFRDPRHLAGKLEAATRLNRLAENLPEQGLSSNSDELRNWFINNKDLDLKNGMDNPHRDKVIEYQYMKNQYHAAEEELNRRQKWFDYTKEGLTNLNKMNSSFHRPFMNSRELTKMGKDLNNIVNNIANSLEIKINPSLKDKLNRGERLSKDEYYDLKGIITEEMKNLEKELINAKNTVEQIKEKAYNAYTRGSVFQKIFSSDRHITEKLDEMIQKEQRQSEKYERDHSRAKKHDTKQPTPAKAKHDHPLPKEIVEKSMWKSYLQELRTQLYDLQMNQMGELAKWYKTNFPHGQNFSSDKQFLEGRLDRWWNRQHIDILKNKELLKVNPFESSEKFAKQIQQSFTNHLTEWSKGITRYESRQPTMSDIHEMAEKFRRLEQEPRPEFLNSLQQRNDILSR